MFNMAMVIIIRPELICIHEDATSHNHQVRIIKTTSLMSLGLNVFPIPQTHIPTPAPEADGHFLMEVPLGQYVGKPGLCCLSSPSEEIRTR
ncbi:hypothetical protein CDAR_42421 [Caerostris darwini]|uniref:Uncharacterized protein n=1 Tax=Caerostris darwini TaxID=1538125 RepID=A0AAV4RJB2_9ARAC|nr:hypothetical protein CDAR_42421 [Caerostris darwini]